MGCDIHLNLEYRKTINNEKKWCDGNLYELNPYFDGIDQNEEQLIKSYMKSENRDYHLFSVLANVRNYNYYNIEPISEPKGFPENASRTISEDYKAWGQNAHSASYFTLKELIYVKNNYKDLTVYESLNRLIQEIKKNYIRIFHYGYKSKNENFEQYADEIRIVFWFDN